MYDGVYPTVSGSSGPGGVPAPSLPAIAQSALSHVPGASRLPATVDVVEARGVGKPNLPASTRAISGNGSIGGVSSHGSATSANDDLDPDFEEMVSDLRRSFVGWLKKIEMGLKQHHSDLRRSRQSFEEEKLSVWQQFMAEKHREVEKIREDRRRSEEETAVQLRQVQADVEEARRRINEERSRLQEETSQKRRTVAHEYEKFKQEYSLFEAERNRIVCPEIAAETTVELNVGGTIFQTARSTLVQQSGSFLELLLSGRPQISRDRCGRIFINRDPEHFRTILNFLRNPQTPPMPRDAVESEMLVREASFYGVHFFPFSLVFACGGHDGYEHLRAMEVLDVGNQCWRPCKPMSTERAYFGASTLRNRLFLFGGQNLDYKALCELEIYDCLLDTWVAGPSLSVPRRNCGSVELGGRMYSIGGFDGSKIINSVEAYDDRMRGWMQLEPLPAPRSSAMACAHNEKVWVLGGTSGTRLRSLDVYDPRAARWETSKVDMTEVRSAGQACSCVRHLFSLGGTDNDQNVHVSMECMDVDTGLFSPRSSMQEARMDFGCVVIADSVMVGGGQNGSVLSTTEFYRPELDKWQAGPSMMFPRYGHQYLNCTL